MKRISLEDIEATRLTERPRYGMSEDGYTLRSGAPTCWMIRLRGERRFRRLMCWHFSNAGTLFVRIKGKPVIVGDLIHCELQDLLVA